MKSILVLRPGAIGDALLAFPVLKALKKQYEGTHLTLVSNAQVLPLAQAFGVAEETFNFQDIKWSELFSSSGIHTSFMRDLLAQTDLVICWMRDPDGIIERNLKMSGIKHCIIAPGRPPAGEHLHIVDYLARAIGLPNVGEQFIAPSSGSLLNPSFKGTTTKHIIAIHPGSGAVEKCWTASRFAEVIKRLWEQSYQVLLLAGPADTERVNDLLQDLSPPPGPGIFQMLTRAPLLEVAQHLQHCMCYLGNDSGITHLAAMLGIPTVAIFGPTDPKIWRPMGPFVKVLHEPRLENVSVDAVFQAII
jgi:heptosyltransferase III